MTNFVPQAEKQSSTGTSNKPEGWQDLDAEYYAPTSEDVACGLSEVLQQVRDLGVEALEKMFRQIGLGHSFYRRLEGIPIGLDRGLESYVSSRIEPGKYGIILGRNSEAIEDWLRSPEPPLNRKRGHLLQDVTHEMMHIILVGDSILGTPLSLSNLTGPAESYMMTATEKERQDGRVSLEEGLVESFALIALKMRQNQTDFEEEATKLEDFLYENQYEGMPLTLVSAHLLNQMSPEQRLWYLSAAQTGDYLYDPIFEAFGEDFEPFLEILTVLDWFENLPAWFELKDEQVIEIIENVETAFAMIDAHLGAKFIEVPDAISVS